MIDDDNSFGSCCDALAECLAVPNTVFRREDNGIWYLTVGHVDTPQGPGFFDEAVIHCPFCGAKLQDRAQIARRSKSAPD
jgi:ferredoxin